MYVLAIYFLVFLASILELKKKISRQQALILFGIVLVFFLIRYNVGLDNKIYIYLYERIQNPISEAFQYHASRNIGFNLLQYFIKRNSHSYTFFVFIVNLLIIGLVSYTIYQNSDCTLFSLSVFISSGFLQVYYSSGIRQACAMALFFFAFYKSLPQKNYGQYYLLCIVACSFHETALISLIFPLIQKSIPFIKKNQKKLLIIGSIISLCLFLILGIIAPQLAQIIGYDIPLTHILSYFTAESFSLLGVMMEILLTAIIVVLYIWNDDKKSEFVYFQVLITIFTFWFYISFAKFSLVSRICDLVQVIFIILIPTLLIRVKEEKKKILVLLVIFLSNAFILYSDINATCVGLRKKIDTNINIVNYPYFTVFDEEAITDYEQLLQ